MKRTIRELFLTITENPDASMALNSQEINAQDEFGETLLHLAVNAQRVDVVEFLVRNQIDPKVRNKNGMTGMALAAGRNSVKILNLLLQAYKNELSTDEQSEMLVCAVTCNAIDSVVCMLKHGFDPLQSFREDPIIVWALQSENLNMIKLLVDAGSSINAVNDEGQSLLYITAAEGQTDILEWLIQMGADIEMRDYSGTTALMIACCYNHAKVVEQLVRCGANVNVRDNDGDTSLLFAIRYAGEEIIDTLLQNNADVSIRNNDGRGFAELIADIGDEQVREKTWELFRNHT